MRTFAAKLRDARVAAGYDSAESFAEFIGIHPHTYRKYERDPTNANSAEPDFFTLTRLCEHLKVTPNDLLPEASADRPFQQATSGKSSETQKIAKIQP